MEILYGVLLLIAFILGLGMGFAIPFFVKKYMKLATEETKASVKEKEENNDIDNNIPYIPKDLLTEWMTGKEAKPNDEQ